MASGTDREYFTPEALNTIYQFSKGVPRLVNQICDNAFLTGYVEEAQIIDERIITEVINDSPIFQLADTKKKFRQQDQDGLDAIVTE